MEARRIFLSTSFLCFLVLMFFGFSSAAENITITTYYPSPYGSYRQLSSNQVVIGSSYTTNPTYANGTLYVQNRVGIGTTTPGAALEVRGQVKIVDGVQGVGKVLTSDANGVGTWTEPGYAYESYDLNPWSAGGDTLYTRYQKTKTGYVLSCRIWCGHSNIWWSIKYSTDASLSIGKLSSGDPYGSHTLRVSGRYLQLLGDSTVLESLLLPR